MNETLPWQNEEEGHSGVNDTMGRAVWREAEWNGLVDWEAASWSLG